MGLMQFDDGLIKSMMDEAFNRQARAYFHTLPTPDPQYTADEVAELLSIDVATVRSYMKLATTHRRHLPFVRCTDTARGQRVTLSAIRAWQQRNLHQPDEAAAKEPESLLRISHRRAAQRDKRSAA